MAWSETEPGQWSSDSGLLLENRPGVGPYLYSEELEDEIPDSGLPLVDFFRNPLLSVVTVDPDTGKLPVSLMPPIAITDLFPVNSQAEMLGLSAQKGDLAIRNDLPGAPAFILAGDDSTFLGNWKEITVRYISWNHIQGVPSQFPPTDHNHDLEYYKKLEVDSALSQKRNVGNIPAIEVSEDTSHRFTTDLEKSKWNTPANWPDIQNKPTAFPPTNHNHDADYYKKSETDLVLSQKRNVGNIPANEITEDSSHRFVTDTQIASWNSGGSSAGGFDVGDVKTSARNTPPVGWLQANGDTIGNLSSGANRVGAEYQNLFILLWNDWSNTVLPILSSTGSATTRGGSAVADWNAGKRLPIPNLCGRTPIGAGPATGITTRTIGESVGEESHTLTLPETPNHDHGGGNHSHPVDRANFLMQGGGISIKVGYSATSTNNTRASGNVITPQGGGLPHNNMQPSLVLNYFIKY
ncbi:hypothetical protein FH593_15310 [Leptospira interrogans]|uniref:phage tail protein n=1 Tax=Leptospira interrogans TaxID=173 RepID=UPI001EF067B8|nr:hypothetical protein [Leptospira interrogans]ULG87919.1 hypothetical protein FH593_15310 [Leptospira interrogans]